MTLRVDNNLCLTVKELREALTEANGSLRIVVTGRNMADTTLAHAEVMDYDTRAVHDGGVFLLDDDGMEEVLVLTIR